jgi:hypothetical protein
VSNKKGKDYYFQLVLQDNGDTGLDPPYFIITSKVTWDKEHHLNDSPIHCIPNTFVDAMENYYEYIGKNPSPETFKGDADEGRQILLSKGFIEKELYPQQTESNEE